MELNTIILGMVNNRRIIHKLGPYTILSCKEVEPDIPIRKDILIHSYNFTNFAVLYLNIYYKLVQINILTPPKRKEKLVFAL